MKTSTLILTLCVFFVSCSKENISLPENNTAALATVSEDAVAETAVSFKPVVSGSVLLTPGVNTLQSADFNVAGETVYMSKLVYTVTGTKPDLSYFRLYLNGGQVPATISYYNDTITVVAKRIIPIASGDHNYTLMAKTFGTSGSSFSITLQGAVLANSKRLFVKTYNLPITGNRFTFN